jgi:nitrogen fixation NifU-like protein
MGYYSDTLMDHFQSPRNNGKMEAPDRIGLVGTPGQGLFMLFCLRLADDVITEAKYQTNGCGASIACGSILTEMVLNRSIGECRAITAEQVFEALGGVPPDKAYCPGMAVAALQNALNNPAPAVHEAATPTAQQARG